MAIDEQYVKIRFQEDFLKAVRRSNEQVARVMVLPPQGVLRQSVVAADGWCAPTTPSFGDLDVLRPSWWVARTVEVPKPAALACGCSMNVLETGWHETGCEVVGEYLCRPVTRQQPAETRSPAVECAA